MRKEKEMNVSKEADRQFMEELQRTDRPRYDRIIRAALKETHRIQKQASDRQPVELLKAA